MNVYHDLMPFSLDDYERILRGYVGEVSQAPGVRAIFRFGEVSNPGISDLDVLVVVRDDVEPSSLRRVGDATRADAATRYLFPHPPLVAPQGSIANLRFVHSLCGLSQIWGDPLEVRPPGERDRGYLRLADYVDFSFALRSALRSFAEASVGLRTILLLLKSCVHSLDLASSVSGHRVGGGAAERVDQLRAQSLLGRGDAARSAAALAAECVAALGDADAHLEPHLQQRGIIRASAIRECVYHPDGRFYLFETPFTLKPAPPNGRLASEGGIWRLVRIDPSVEVFPGFYLAQFATYGNAAGAYAAAHRTFFGRRAADLIADPAYREVLQIRSQTVQRIHDVVRRGALIPMVPLGIGFRMPERIRPSCRRRVLRRLVARRAFARSM